MRSKSIRVSASTPEHRRRGITRIIGCGGSRSPQNASENDDRRKWGYEQPAVFRNNDLPGIMLASAAQRLIYRYAVKPMQRGVVLTANSDGYRRLEQNTVSRSWRSSICVKTRLQPT